MFKIGEFSKLCKVTIKALRYYDKLGLLKPDYIDEDNGYRYYKTEKLKQASEIIMYKNMGFSLEQISKVLVSKPNSDDIFEMLCQKKSETNDIIYQEKEKIKKINNLINKLKRERKMNEIILKTLPEVIVASMRLTIKEYNDLHTVVPKMGKKMQAQGVVCRDPFYCFNVYHDAKHKEFDVDVEICEAVVKKGEDKEELIFKKINKVDSAACLFHKGPYSSLGVSYTEIYKWIEENSYRVIDKPRESFIDGCWNKADPEEWLTEIQIPVDKV